VGLDNTGAVKGIETISSLETPGLGTKTNEPDFRSQFIGYHSDHLPAPEVQDNTEYKVRFARSKTELEKLKAMQSKKAVTFEWDAVTGATLSSNGMYEAVKLAVISYEEAQNG
jgi:Na+-translocating ferredoxin:NAD+ oxidoreductase RnfG subunit